MSALRLNINISPRRKPLRPILTPETELFTRRQCEVLLRPHIQLLTCNQRQILLRRQQHIVTACQRHTLRGRSQQYFLLKLVYLLLQQRLLTSNIRSQRLCLLCAGSQ